ncbi:diguanylate cyclase domain-containing protein [Marinicella sediminis]|uniref:diguanylate cyclase n=2 Tax=Marinicella sediminis TaxID=1792834 RepID=A0ABV7J4A3_9GAMM
MNNVKPPWKLILLTGMLCLSMAFAQPGLSELDEQIEQCQSLEDDHPERAISLAEQWLNTISQISDPVSYGRFLSCQGWAYAVLEQGDMAKAVAYQLERLSARLNDSKASVNLLRRAGSIFHRTGNRIGAADNYQAALEKAHQLSLNDEKIPLLVNLGVLNSEIREHDSAIGHYYAALRLMDQLDDFRYHAPVLFNLAVTLSGQKRFKEALEIYHQAEALITEQWPQQRIGQVYMGLATAYGALGQLTQAGEYISKTHDTLPVDNQQTVFAYTVKVFQALVSSRQGVTDGLSELADEAAAFYLRPENEAALTTADSPLNTLSDLYESLNMPQQALDVSKVAQRLEKRFQDSFNKRVMAQMQARLRDIEQQNELAELKTRNTQTEMALAESAHKRSLILLLAIALGLVLVVSWLWHLRSKRQLVRQSMLDTLTRMSNRRGMMSWLKIQHMPKEPQKRMLWLIDIDHFKTINDEYGHEAGDTTLVQVANCLAGLLNDQRFLARWAGEEFLLVTQDISRSDAGGFADLLLEQVSAMQVRHGLQRFNVTVSVGVSIIKDDSMVMWNRALSQADKALFVAKDRGKNCMSMATDF